MILVIDNYDSFTYNLVHLIGAEDADIRVHRNDTLTVNEALALSPRAIVLSPGPCTPTEAGICVDLASAAKANHIPMMGVCLGHQSIIQAAGGEIIRAKRQMHGRTSPVRHDGTGLFEGVPSPFVTTRYHSLVGNIASMPRDIRVTAYADDDDEPMGCQWGEAPIFGVQFHPESIASEHGATLVRNFLATAKSGRVAA